MLNLHHRVAAIGINSLKVIFICALVLLLGIAWVGLLEHSGLLRGADHYSYDLFFRLRGAVAPSKRIVVVAIDEKSLDEFGRWPIRRHHYAAALERPGSAVQASHSRGRKGRAPITPASAASPPTAPRALPAGRFSSGPLVSPQHNNFYC